MSNTNTNRSWHVSYKGKRLECPFQGGMNGIIDAASCLDVDAMVLSEEGVLFYYVYLHKTMQLIPAQLFYAESDSDRPTIVWEDEPEQDDNERNDIKE